MPIQHPTTVAKRAQIAADTALCCLGLVCALLLPPRLVGRAQGAGWDCLLHHGEMGALGDWSGKAGRAAPEAGAEGWSLQSCCFVGMAEGAPQSLGEVAVVAWGRMVGSARAAAVAKAGMRC